LIRQVLGAVAEFDKVSMVAKLKGARDGGDALNGKCDEPKSDPAAGLRLGGAGPEAAEPA
jgi:hypothetical protein